MIDRALVLNPNLASAWFLAGFLGTWNGEPDAAVEHFTRAIRMSPLDPELYRMQAGTAAAHLFAGRFDAASSWAEKAFRELPSFLIGRHSCGEPCARGPVGRGAACNAASCVSSIRRSRISKLGDWLPIHQQEDLATFSDGLRRAGLPE